MPLTWLINKFVFSLLVEFIFKFFLSQLSLLESDLPSHHRWHNLTIIQDHTGIFLIHLHRSSVHNLLLKGSFWITCFDLEIGYKLTLTGCMRHDNNHFSHLEEHSHFLEWLKHLLLHQCSKSIANVCSNLLLLLPLLSKLFFSRFKGFRDNTNTISLV